MFSLERIDAIILSFLYFVLSQIGLEQDLETTMRPCSSQINPERVNVLPFTMSSALPLAFGYYGVG
jgi:hypothetical protein